MKKLVGLVLAATVAAVTAAAFPGAIWPANQITFAAKLTARAEVPPQRWKNPGASGSFVAVIRGSKMKWTLRFTGLTGLATANISFGAVGSSGRLVVPLCVSCFVPLTGTSTLSKALLNDLKADKLYVNVETKKNPRGEIRGQLSEG